ncbi:MAG: hypothetical protein FWC40_02435 [Proteobacteria bacterium]|nr:hypothetical protein [Pseudomonadota bacterium]
MAWKDSFERVVDTLVDGFGLFLDGDGDLALNERARMQEVCRDFCMFLHKEPHKATAADYAVYLRRHSTTPENEADYREILEAIRQFSSASAAVAQPQPRLENRELNRRLARKGAATFQFDVSDDLLRIAREKSHLGRARDATPFRLDVTGDLLGGAREIGTVTPFRPVVVDSPAARQDLQTKTPPRRVSSVSEPSRRVPSVSEQLGKFDFTLDESLRSSVSTNPRLEGGGRSISDSYQGRRHRVSTDAGQNPILALERDDFRVDSVEGLEDYLTEGGLGAIAQEVAFSVPEARSQGLQAELRPVDSIEYCFSEDGMRHMRGVEATRQTGPRPIDPRLVSGFRPYVFAGKYVVDRPLPEVQDYRPVKVSMVTKAFPFIPALVVGAVAAAAFAFVSLAGLVLGFLAVLLAIFAIPDVLPRPQQTAHAALASYVAARNGRCYHGGLSLLAAQKTDTDDEGLDLSELWRDDAPAWPKAVVSRIIAGSVPELQTVSGSDSQNAMLLLYETSKAYFLVPLIRLNGRWLVCDPTLGKHAFDPVREG